MNKIISEQGNSLGESIILSAWILTAGLIGTALIITWGDNHRQTLKYSKRLPE